SWMRPSASSTSGRFAAESGFRRVVLMYGAPRSPAVQPQVVRWGPGFVVNRPQLAISAREEDERRMRACRHVKVRHAADEDLVVAAIAEFVRLAFEIGDCARHHRRAVSGVPDSYAVPFVRACIVKAVR